MSIFSDNGRKYVDHDFEVFCRKKGIRFLNTVVHNHQMNGKTERLNRTLENKVRTLLIDSGFEKRFWCEAVLFATYLLKRCPTVATVKISAEVWYNEQVNFASFQDFGCMTYTRVHKEKSRKLDDHSKVSDMVGSAPQG